jgi:DNA-binding MarR family transcriptional regulator
VLSWDILEFLETSWKAGDISASQIARELGVSRSQVYRCLNSLRAKGQVKRVRDEKAKPGEARYLWSITEQGRKKLRWLRSQGLV